MNELLLFGLELLVFILIIAGVSYLSYEQGYYMGLKELCPQGTLIVDLNGQVTCQPTNNGNFTFEEVIIYDHFQI